MDIKIFDNAEQIACAAAQLYKDLIGNKPNAVLGLATGATPVPTYKKLIELYNNGEISFKDVAESKRYAEAIKAAGGIDLQLLGIGTNGHIAFNEPADKFTDEAFKVTLTQSTINSNQKYFGDVPMPRYAMTMGIGSIMRSKKILLIATGESHGFG